jgi:phosphoheptose isomerase
LFGQQAITRVNESFTWMHVGEGLSKSYSEVMLQCGTRRNTGVATSMDRAMDRAIHALDEAKRRLRLPMTEAAMRLGDCLTGGGRVLVYGHADSADDADKWVTELTGRLTSHPGWPVIALRGCGTPAWLTQDRHLLHQVDTLARAGDALFAICTGPVPPSITACLRQARVLGLQRMLLAGPDVDRFQDLTDVLLDVPLADARDVRQVHMLLLDVLLDLVQEHMAAEVRRTGPRSLPSALARPRRTKTASGPLRRPLINTTGKTMPQ